MSTLVDVVVAVGEELRRQERHLCELDAAVGDGDHGVTLVRCWEAAEQRLGDLHGESPPGLLRALGEVVISVGGGAVGPLLGTALLQAADAADGDAPPGIRIASALEACDHAIQRRGRAAVGDRTMLDALHPAAQAARGAAMKGGAAPAVVDAAATAAEQGADATATMLARAGRATRMGELALGHVDPGAASVAIMLRAAANHLAGGVR